MIRSARPTLAEVPLADLFLTQSHDPARFAEALLFLADPSDDCRRIAERPRIAYDNNYLLPEQRARFQKLWHLPIVLTPRSQ
jgi:hypothetical protein